MSKRPSRAAPTDITVTVISDCLETTASTVGMIPVGEGSGMYVAPDVSWSPGCIVVLPPPESGVGGEGADGGGLLVLKVTGLTVAGVGTPPTLVVVDDQCHGYLKSVVVVGRRVVVVVVVVVDVVDVVDVDVVIHWNSIGLP